MMAGGWAGIAVTAVGRGGMIVIAVVVIAVAQIGDDAAARGVAQRGGGAAVAVGHRAAVAGGEVRERKDVVGEL